CFSINCTKEYKHGTHRRWHRRLAYADHRFCLRPEQARRPGVGTDFRELRPAGRLARGEEPERAAADLQRSRHVVLLRSLLGVRARGGTRVACCRRRRWCTRSAPDQGASAARLVHRALADGRRVRHVLLPAPGAGPWLLLAAFGALPA